MALYFDFPSGRDHYCVMGNPIAHSLSPRIHQAFADQTGEAIDYQAILVPTDGFETMVRAFCAAGGQGANITLPFKQAAWALCDRRTGRADRAVAVNTLSFSQTDGISGDNTDGIGLVRDLRDNLHCRLDGAGVLILGAGGAVRGVIDPLFDEHPARIIIANRTPEKAREIAAAFADRGVIEGHGYEDLAGQRFPVIINGTSLSLQGEVPSLPTDVVADGGVVYDMMYSDEATCFMRWAEARGAGRTADGLGMLVEQAAESFFIWRGIRPDTAPIMRMLRRGGD